MVIATSTSFSYDEALSTCVSLPDGPGIYVSRPTVTAWWAMAGPVGLRMLADRTGQTGGLSAVLARPGFHPVHDRGRVLTDVACSIAAGGVDLYDIEALRALSEVFGSVPRTPPHCAPWARSATPACTALTRNGRRPAHTCGI